MPRQLITAWNVWYMVKGPLGVREVLGSDCPQASLNAVMTVVCLEVGKPLRSKPPLTVLSVRWEKVWYIANVPGDCRDKKRN